MNQAIVEKFTEYVATLPQSDSRAAVDRVVAEYLKSNAGTIFAQSNFTEIERISRLGDVVLYTLGRASSGVAFGFCSGMSVLLLKMAVDLFSNPDVFLQDNPVVLRNLPKLKAALAILAEMGDQNSTVSDWL